MKIGNIELENSLMLAPMAGVTDHAFRRVCRECGAQWIVSEMVSAKALCYEQKSRKRDSLRTAPLARVRACESPMAIQIFGSEPSYMAEAASMLETGEYLGNRSDISPSAIDINMGCPVHKVVSNGEGSALMKNPDLAGRIVEAVKGALKEIPVTVKIRAGWDSDSKNAVEVARVAEEAGASLICVHGRTREQMYNPGVDLDIIASVKREVGIPVVGNGDIYSGADAKRMLEYTGCDGLMIGRGALGNPWIFSEIAATLEGREYISPTFCEKMDTARRQVALMREDKGEYIASAEAKKQVAWYVKGIDGAASLRDRIMRCASIDEIFLLIDEIKREVTEK